jgi:hypothetical protein
VIILSAEQRSRNMGPIIKAARANEAPILPLSPAVQTRLLESLKPVDTSSRGSGAPVLKCYFTGLKAKNIDEGGDCSRASTMAAVINTTEPANAVSDDEEEPSANTLSLRHTAMRTQLRQTLFSSLLLSHLNILHQLAVLSCIV